MLARLWLRVVRGAPAPPEDGRWGPRLLARAVHASFYVLLLAMPASGALAWFGGVAAAAEIHAAAMPLIVALVLLHALAALWEHWVRGTDVLRRMIRPAD